MLVEVKSTPTPKALSCPLVTYAGLLFRRQ